MYRKIMKPVIIGVIIGVVVTIAIIGSFLAILSIQQAAEEAELAIVMADYERFLDYELEMNRLQSDECWSADFPQSFVEMREQMEELKAELALELWKIEQGISEPSEPTVNDYRMELQEIQKKYRTSEYAHRFIYEVYQCNNPDYHSWQALEEAVAEERYGSRQDTPNINKDFIGLGIDWSDFNAISDNNQGQKDKSKFVQMYNDLDECVPKSGEPSCLEKIEPGIEELCSKYHPSEQNCIEATIQDFRVWLSKRFP